MNRFNEKTFLATPIPGLKLIEDVVVLPPYITKSSNLVSRSENLLLRWLELNFLVNTKKSIRLCNF